MGQLLTMDKTILVAVAEVVVEGVVVAMSNVKCASRLVIQLQCAIIGSTRTMCHLLHHSIQHLLKALNLKEFHLIMLTWPISSCSTLNLLLMLHNNILPFPMDSHS